LLTKLLGEGKKNIASFYSAIMFMNFRELTKPQNRFYIFPHSNVFFIQSSNNFLKRGVSGGCTLSERLSVNNSYKKAKLFNILYKTAQHFIIFIPTIRIRIAGTIRGFRTFKFAQKDGLLAAFFELFLCLKCSKTSKKTSKF
jgi:hypothetical protein